MNELDAEARSYYFHYYSSTISHHSNVAPPLCLSVFSALFYFKIPCLESSTSAKKWMVFQKQAIHHMHRETVRDTVSQSPIQLWRSPEHSQADELAAFHEPFVRRPHGGGPATATPPPHLYTEDSTSVNLVFSEAR